MDLPSNRPAPHWLARAFSLLLTLFFIGLAISITLAQAALTALIFCWGALALQDPRWRPRRLPLAWPFGVFVAISLLSSLLSADPGRSLWGSKDLLLISIFYLVVATVPDLQEADRRLRIFLAVLTLMALYGLGQILACVVDFRVEDVLSHRIADLFDPTLEKICFSGGFSRTRGPFSIYMTFGGILMMGTLYILGLLAVQEARGIPWRVAQAGLTSLALITTFARNAWVGLVVGTLGLLAVTRRAQILLVLGLYGLVILVAPAKVVSRIKSIGDAHDPTVTERIYMWQSGIRMLRDHPILGTGTEMVSRYYGAYRDPRATKASTGHLHNAPLQVAVSRGVPGFLAWGWIWLAFFRNGWRIFRRLPRDAPQARATTLGSLAAIVGFLVAGLFEYNFGDSEVVMVTYVLMALPFIAERSARISTSAGSG